MAKKIYTDEEARLRKNARQREYSKRTGYKHVSKEAKEKYQKKTYKNYTINLRLVEDCELIEIIENKKKEGYSASEVIKRLILENNA